MEDQERLLKQVFGDSSESDADEEHRHSTIDQPTNPTWQPIKQFNGLWLCRDFLSPERQSTLLSDIQNEGWFTESTNNQAMRFGDLPTWAIQLSNSIREIIQFGEEKNTSLLSSNLLRREPLFDQLIVNLYQPGEGICAHVDLMRFEDGITIVSLESSCVMHFTKVENETIGEEDHQLVARIPVYLTPGSLVLLSGDARYLWKHEINRKPGFQIWEGQELNQKRRTSITLRKLCRSI